MRVKRSLSVLEPKFNRPTCSDSDNVELFMETLTLENQIGRNLLPEDIERIARQNPKISDHLDVVKRKEMLELVLEKIKSLSELEGNANYRGDRQGGRQRTNAYSSPERKRWLF